jgi:hypothetical protein
LLQCSHAIFPSDAVEFQGPFDPLQVEVVVAKHLHIGKPVSKAQLVVSLELVPVAGSAETLKIFPAIRIAELQPTNQPRWHDVVHVTAHTVQLEVRSAGFDFAVPP